MDHLRMPHLRPIQPIGLQKDGKQFVALRDPQMLCKQTMVIPVQAMPVLQFFRGEEDLDAIAQRLKAPVEQLAALVQGLDQVGLLWGPTFERLERELKEEIATRGAYPMGAAGSLGESAEQCRKRLDAWLAETDDPELDEPVRGLVAPHLDYERGWPNYAAAYRCIERVERPDRIVILGTNHFGLGDGVVLAEHGFETPLGRVSSDVGIVSAMIERLGKPLIIDQLDHMPEHSVQLHLPWLQHRWGDVPVVAALVPDPLAPMVEEDGERVTGERFVETLREVLDAAGGRTFFIASADLSHVGPQFGEPRPVDDQRRHDVELHDREMMAKFLTGDAEEFLGAMRWCNNPTRWCSVGNMSAALMLARPAGVELIDYRQAVDEQGMVLVSSAAMAMF